MAFIHIVISVILVISASANIGENNNDDEMDQVIDMLLNGEYDNAQEIDLNKKDHKDSADEVPMLYPDGAWKCGNCTNMDQMKLLHTEVYDQDTNYDDYVEDYMNLEVQIGLSLKNMRCVTLETEEEIDVRLVTGACSSEQVTIGIMGAAHCVISAYG